MTEPSSSALHDKPLSSSNIIAVGTTGLIYALDNDHILKRCPPVSDPFIHQALAIELRAYNQLGQHPRIATVHETTEKSIVLERGECLRRRLQRQSESISESEQIPLHTKLQWAKEAAEGLRYIHERGIIQGDVGCHNLILTQSGIKFIDFAGSGNNNEPALVAYEWCSYRPDPTQHPDAAASIRTDIFAFGSALFEIEMGLVPYHELQGVLDNYPLMRRVEGLFGARQYPDLEGLVLGGVIRGCWDGRYERMEVIIGDIAGCVDGI